MRSIWNGTIGFGLVNIPIKLFSAVQNSSLDMDMLDGRDHAPIRFQRINENTRKEVPYDKIVKGYKVNEDYVILEEADFEEASPEKTKIIAIENFVNIKDINPMYYETSYYAAPGSGGGKAYGLLLQALVKSKTAGLARFVMRNTENLCVLHPVDQVLVITKIRFAEEIRSPQELNLPNKVNITKKELEVGMALIKQYTGAFDILKFKDEYTGELLKIIKAKAKGKRPTIKKMKPRTATSDDLYEQLMESLKTKKGA